MSTLAVDSLRVQNGQGKRQTAKYLLIYGFYPSCKDITCFMVDEQLLFLAHQL